MSQQDYSFEHTWNPDFQDERYGMTPWLKENIERIYKDANDEKNLTIIDELI